MQQHRVSSRSRWARTLGDLIFDIGGGVRDGKKFKAAQAGGPSGGCIPAEHLNVSMDYDSLKELGAMMGSGGSDRHGREHLHGRPCPLLPGFHPGRKLRQVHPVPSRHQAHARDPRSHRARPRSGGRHRASDRPRRRRSGTRRSAGSARRRRTLSSRPSATSAHEYEAHIRDKKCPACVCNALFEAPCSHTCPAGTSVPKYIALIGHRRFTDALRLIRDHNPFVSVCGRVCNAPCESQVPQGSDRRAALDPRSQAIRGRPGRAR